MESFFDDKYVTKLQPYIQETVDNLLDAMKSKGCSDGPVDLIKEFALPVPSYVRLSQVAARVKPPCMARAGIAEQPLQIIYHILGVPAHDLEFLTNQAAIRSNGSGTAREASAASQYASPAGHPAPLRPGLIADVPQGAAQVPRPLGRGAVQGAKRRPHQQSGH